MANDLVKWRINTDDGEYVVTAPADATEEEVRADFEAHHAAVPAAKAKNAPPPKDHFAETASDQSFLQNLGSGFGGALTGLGMGARQLIPGMNPPSKQEVQEWKKSMEGLRGTVGGFLGEGGGYVAAAAPLALMAPATGPVAVASAGATNAVLGALTPAEDTQERLINTVLSGASGAIGQGVASRLAQRTGRGVIPSQLTQEAAQHIANAEELGMRFSPGQLTGNPRLMRLDRSMAQAPIASGAFDRMTDTNQRIANRAFAKAIGETTDEVGANTLQRAHSRLTDIFNSVRDDTPVFLGRREGAQLNRIGRDFGHLLDDTADLRLAGEYQNLINAGGATREQLGALSTKLRQRAEGLISSPQGDRNLARALFEVREAVEDTIQRNLSPKEARTYRQAREQYRNLMTGLATNAINESSGNVNAQALGRAMARRNRSDFTFGNKDTDIARVAHAARAVPQLGGGSDTATKLGTMNLLRGIVPTLGLGTAGAAAGGSTLGPLGALAGAVAAEHVLPRAYVGAGTWAARPHKLLGNAIEQGGRYLVAPLGGLTAMKAAE